MKYIQQHGGVVIYLQQEGRGIGLANKIAAYALQETGVDTVDANRMLGFDDDLRQYSPVKHILNDIGVHQVLLMTNNPRKCQELNKLGVEIVGRIPVLARKTKYNSAYLKSKSERMSHLLGEINAGGVEGERGGGGGEGGESGGNGEEEEEEEEEEEQQRSRTPPQQRSFPRRRATAGKVVRLENFS